MVDSTQTMSGRAHCRLACPDPPAARADSGMSGWSRQSGGTSGAKKGLPDALAAPEQKGASLVRRRAQVTPRSSPLLSTSRSGCFPSRSTSVICESWGTVPMSFTPRRVLAASSAMMRTKTHRPGGALARRKLSSYRMRTSTTTIMGLELARMIAAVSRSSNVGSLVCRDSYRSVSPCLWAFL